MKYILESNDNVITNEEIKLKLYETISQCYIIINNETDTLLQLCGCMSKVYLYLQ